MEINLSELAIKTISRKILLNPSIEPLKWYKTFKLYFKAVNGTEFIETEETKDLVYTLIYFFSKKKNFRKSPLLHTFMESSICVEKGLIIVGGFGCGKSSIMKTFQTLIKEESKFNLKFITTVGVVSEYERTEQIDLNDLENTLVKGHLVIDDLLAEEVASRFGKTDLFKNILFQRCENPSMNTIITMNYDAEDPNDIDLALRKLYRYEGRNFDRILGGFNFVRLEGKSFRK